MKALIEPDGGRILGFMMIGAEAGEVVSVVQMAMQGGLTYTAVRDSILGQFPGEVIKEFLRLPF
jgi:pyruvate/2-oxoglutarate dehydrogenase complex dihydrolipoamide dehydrogenase (E3) component